MIEKNTTEKSIREELLQRTFEQLFAVMRQMHRDVSPKEPLLSHPQARLVFAIAKHKEGISVKELARMSNVTAGAITQFADALIIKGLVTREEDPDDRRIVRLKLTPAAKSQMEAFRKEFLASAVKVFEVLSTEELRQLTDLLAKVGPPVKGECDMGAHPKSVFGGLHSC
ncbi:MAG: MarR family transcriptional regulator [Dehalococcoidales bacterium]|nr:MarR family transcriptional regulator [Dehalococcoidales bacterium]